MQHIEEAGIHSGDSSCVLPAVDLAPHTLETIRDYTFQLALALKVIGLMNLQFAIQRDGRCLRHRSESARLAHRALRFESHGRAAGKDCRAPDDRPQAPRVSAGRTSTRKDLETGTHFYVKSPVFPWSKFPGVDTVLGPEMKSTGEVMGVADNFGEAFAKAQIPPDRSCRSGTVFFSVNDRDKTSRRRAGAAITWSSASNSSPPKARRDVLEEGRH